MPTVDKLAEEIGVTGKPVLFYDTCSFLDLIRATVREKGLEQNVINAAALFLWEAENKKLTLVVSSVFATEVNDNYGSDRGDFVSHFKKFNDTLTELNKARSVFGQRELPLEEHEVDTLNNIEKLCESLKTASRNVNREVKFIERAFRRVEAKIPPSRSGAIKDSVMFEELLELSRLTYTSSQNLTYTSSQNKIVLLSSDKKAFSPGGHLDPYIGTEFAATGILFARNWNEAWHKLNKP